MWRVDKASVVRWGGCLLQIETNSVNNTNVHVSRDLTTYKKLFFFSFPFSPSITVQTALTALDDL